ncbi:MAG: YbaB/EbfC family nucleoid-associated protein [Clostridia bacterium]|nr:YbaB/EbfC family nucleoid-associated protein [Clostridia bacterium]NLF20289.1 YbaB/EbfC family nucleoid-associated protein [Clostridiaceae bacterium]
MARPRGGFPGGLGGGNMNQLMQQAQKMQQDMQKAQEEIAAMEIEYSAGGGMVTAKINGEHKLLGLTIAPEAVDPEDVEMLQDMIVAAINGATEKLEEASQAKMSRFSGLTGGLGF